jgi:hypothetical protein
MSRKTARGLQIGPVLAIVGGGLGVASLLMPWFVVNNAGLQSAIANIATSDFFRDQQLQSLPTDHIQAGMQMGLSQTLPEYAGHLKGYQFYQHNTVLAEAAAAGIAILVGLLGLFGLLNRRGLILFACAIGLVARPIYALVQPPAASTLEPMGFTNAHLLNPTLGFWLSIAAGVVVLASTFGMTTKAAVQYDVPVGKYGDSGPFVPQIDTSTAAIAKGGAYSGGGQAYSPAPAPFVPGVGGAMQSSAGYGAAGSPGYDQSGGGGYGTSPAIYGTDPVRPAAPAAGSPSVGGQRSVAPPKL